MFNFWKWLIGSRPPVSNPRPPVVVTYTVRVEVFEGDPQADNKIPGATVTLGDRVATADGAGNAEFTQVLAGSHHLTVAADRYNTVEQDVTVPSDVIKVSTTLAFKPLARLEANGKIFTCEGQPWRWKGVSAFKLLNRFANGEDITPFLEAYQGFNILRIFSYTPASDWGTSAWDMPTAQQVRDFVKFVEPYGFYVELVLLTSDESSYIGRADALVSQLNAAELPSLLLEIGNEPLTHKNINVKALKQRCEQSGFLYASGVYEDSKQWFGKYGTAHTGRDSEWPRRAHDLMEYYGGGGPNSPDEPACRAPWVADEPIRPDQASGGKMADAEAYYGTASLLGAGGTVHNESGKLAVMPNEEEKIWTATALFAMNAFPADAPLGAYNRPSDNSLRTYTVGPYMVRVRPTTSSAPEPGWITLDSTFILWKR